MAEKGGEKCPENIYFLGSERVSGTEGAVVATQDMQAGTQGAGR